MNKQIHPALIAVVVVVLIAVVGGALYYTTNPHVPSGVKYTPGVPPWKMPGVKNYNPQGDYGPKHGVVTATATPPSIPGS